MSLWARLLLAGAVFAVISGVALRVELWLLALFLPTAFTDPGTAAPMALITGLGAALPAVLIAARLAEFTGGAGR